MPENDKTCTAEKKFCLQGIQDSKKDGRKNYYTFQKIPVEYNNGSEASGEEHPFVELPEKSRESKPPLKLSLLILSLTNRMIRS